MLKILSKLGANKNALYFLKDIHVKPIADITLDGKSLNPSSQDRNQLKMLILITSVMVMASLIRQNK